MFARTKSSRNGNLFLELLLIVVGINIALWFEGKFEDYREGEAEQQYLQGLADDLAVDMATLDQAINSNQSKLEQVAAIIPKLATLGELPAQEQAQIMFTPSSYMFFNPSDFTYKSMQESGDFRLLADAQTKERLLRLVRHYQHIDTLQANFIQAMDAEYIPLMMAKFDLITGQISDPELLRNQVFMNFFPYTMEDTQQRLRALKTARQQAGELDELIRGQLAGG